MDAVMEEEVADDDWERGQVRPCAYWGGPQADTRTRDAARAGAWGGQKTCPSPRGGSQRERMAAQESRQA